MICYCHLKQLCNSSSTFNISKIFVLFLKHFTLYWGFPGGSVIKNPPAHVRAAGATGSISGSGKVLGGGNGSPFQYSCLENPMDRETWWAIVHGSQRVRRDSARAQARIWWTASCSFPVCSTVLMSGLSQDLPFEAESSICVVIQPVTGWTVWRSAVPARQLCRWPSPSGHTGKLLGYFYGLYDAHPRLVRDIGLTESTDSSGNLIQKHPPRHTGKGVWSGYLMANHGDT